MTDAEIFVSRHGWSYWLDGDEIHVAVCPYCRHESSFNINAESGLWNCWRANHCGKKGNLRMLERAFPLRGSETPSSPTAVKSNEPEPLPRVAELEESHTALLNDQKTYDWLTDDKGLTATVVNRLNLGLTFRWFPGQKNKSKALVHPYYQGGQLVSVKFRNLTGAGARFSFLKGRPAEVYNVDSIRATKPLIICEGESDCLALLSSDWRNRDLPIVAIPGAMNAKPHWRRFFEIASQRILVFDNDAAGNDGVKHFTAKYPALTFRRVRLPERFKDLSEWLLDPDSDQTRDFDLFCRLASISL